MVYGRRGDKINHSNSLYFSGKTPGIIEIRDEAGKSYGKWGVVGEDGQGGVKHVSWKVEPAISLSAGTYIIVDSDPVSWSQNTKSSGQGMLWANGYLKD